VRLSSSTTTVNTPAPSLLGQSDTTLADVTLGSSASKSEPTKAAAPADEAYLREALKRCSPTTFEAVRAFRATGDYTHLPVIVTGVIERFVERDLRPKLATGADELRLVEDLGLDSLTLMEIVILTEDVLPVTINNDELRHLRTLGHVRQFIECKLRGLPLPAELTTQPCTACQSAQSTASVSPATIS
jgi:acyl carrier protein